LILVNAADSGVEYVLPPAPGDSPWRQVLDTESIENPFCEAKAADKVIVGGRAVRVYSDGTEEVATTPVRAKLTKTI